MPSVPSYKYSTFNVIELHISLYLVIYTSSGQVRVVMVSQ